MDLCNLFETWIARPETSVALIQNIWQLTDEMSFVFEKINRFIKLGARKMAVSMQ